MSLVLKMELAGVLKLWSLLVVNCGSVLVQVVDWNKTVTSLIHLAQHENAAVSDHAMWSLRALLEQPGVGQMALKCGVLRVPLQVSDELCHMC